MIENAPWYVVAAVLSFLGWREWKKAKVVDSAVDQGLKIKDGSIASLEAEVKRLRDDYDRSLKAKREADAETEAIRARWSRRFFAIERDRDILRKIVKDLVLDVRKVKRNDMPVAELNTGLIDDIEFTPVDEPLERFAR